MNAPAHSAVARGLITDFGGRWLIVRPVDDHRWSLPGGLIEDESPRTACDRKIRQQLGIAVAVGELLLTAWTPARSQLRRNRLSFLFDCGIVWDSQLTIRPQHREIAEWQWSQPGDAVRLLHPEQTDRLLAARRGERYLEQLPHHTAAAS